MLTIIHQWLIDHPILQNLIMSMVGSVLVALLLSNWVLLLAFSKVPPQRLGIWWRKARLDAAELRFRQMTKAHNDIQVAVAIYAAHFLQLLFTFGLSLFNCVSFAMLGTGHPGSASDAQIFHAIYGTNIGWSARFLSVVIPMYVFMFVAIRALRFTSFMRSYNTQHGRLLSEIQRLRTKLGLPKFEPPKGPVIGGRIARTVDSAASPEVALVEGSRVRHPKYGEGRVLAMAGEDGNERATIQFERHGVKKLVVGYAQLKLL